MKILETITKAMDSGHGKPKCIEMHPQDVKLMIWQTIKGQIIRGSRSGQMKVKNYTIRGVPIEVNDLLPRGDFLIYW